MRILRHMAGTFILSAAAGAGGIILVCWAIIHGLPALTRLLDAITGS